jgi:hypothetical protein
LKLSLVFPYKKNLVRKRKKKESDQKKRRKEAHLQPKPIPPPFVIFISINLYGSSSEALQVAVL